MATAAADAMTRLTRLLSTANIVLQPSADGNKLLQNRHYTHLPGEQGFEQSPNVQEYGNCY